MCSTCGADRSDRSRASRRLGAFPSSAARWRTPKRCCSSTTATASARKRTSGSISACVPTISDQLAACELAQRCPSRRRAGVEPRQQRGGHRLGAEQSLQGREVLFGERLRRRHQRGLQAVLDRAQHRVQRHHRLAAADLPHQQPLHRAAARQLFADRRHRPAADLRSARTAAPPSASARSAPARSPSTSASPRALPPPRASSQEHQLRQQQLLERQPLAARLALLAHRAGSASPRARPRVGQPLAHPRRRSERLGHVPQGAPHALHERQDLRRAHALGRRIVGDLARCIRRRVGIRRWAFESPPSAWWATLNVPRSVVLPCSTSRVPGS